MPQKQSKTVTRSLRLDETADRILGELAAAAVLGSSKAEVATAILWQWFWNNQEKLAAVGVSLRPPSEATN
jgi:hypothetical protein